jgi:hypothetical protein
MGILPPILLHRAVGVAVGNWHYLESAHFEVFREISQVFAFFFQILLLSFITPTSFEALFFNDDIEGRGRGLI